MRVKETNSINGCSGCVYNRGLGAKHCPNSSMCMAHMREDKKSIIFKPI